MGWDFTVAAGFLLLAQSFHLAVSQNSTDSPGRTIDPSWLRRDQVKLSLGSQNVASNDYVGQELNDITGSASNGTPALDSLALFSEEGEYNPGMEVTETTDGVTQETAPPPVFTTEPPELTEASFPSNATVHPKFSNQSNPVEEGEGTTTPNVVTTQPYVQNSPGDANVTETEGTQAESNATAGSTPEPGHGIDFNGTETTTPVPKDTSNTSSTPSFFASETTQTSPTSATTAVNPITTTTVAPRPTEKANVTDKGSSSGNNSDRALASDLQLAKRREAWGTILGTAMAVAILGLVTYIFLKKKKQRDFSHRKLVEDFPTDPVLRLDNSEPLDLNYGDAAYYNPGLQGDSIQMSNIPASYRK